jgi:hypothetical protein
MTTDKLNYPTTSASITCTLNSLVTGGIRQSAAVDNSSNLYKDVILTAELTLAVGTPGANQCCYVYVAGSPDGSFYDSDDNVVTGSDGGYTFTNWTSGTPTRTAFKLAMTVWLFAANLTHIQTCTLARLFGGVMPYKWVVLVVNSANVTLKSTGPNALSYTPIYTTNG